MCLMHRLARSHACYAWEMELDHVEDHFKKIDHIFNDTTARAHVIIEVEKNRQIGEVLVHWRDHTLTATDTNADMYMALTRAIAKIEKQAIKLKKKIID